ncbi:MAG: caspase family protein [Planctomycetes bacterium]|nr:caspase family protein [Planctomycetota bacterium]
MKTVKSATSRAATAVVVLCGHLATVVLWSVIVGGNVAAAAEDPSIRSGEGQRYAVLIGVEQYRQVPPLVFVINDVEQIGGTLADRGGYQVWRFVETAADTVWHPTRENLLKHLPELLQRPREQDQIIVYFSGHGFVDSEGRLYLAPIDCDPRRLAETGVPVEWLRDLLSACRAQSKLLVIDSCHAGTAKGDERPSDTKALASVSAKDLAAPFERTGGVYTLASSGSQEKSLIWDTKRQSLFSYWLNQGMRGHADRNGDGQVSADELFHYVESQVPLVAESVFQRPQRPDRLVAPGASRAAAVIAPAPFTLEELLDDIAEQLATLMQLRGLSVIGVPEFAVDAKKPELQLGADFGLLGRLCAKELEGRLAARSGGRFNVVAHEALQERLRTRGILVSHLRTRAARNLTVGETPVSALALGILRSRAGRRVMIQCELAGMEDATMFGSAGGVAMLNVSEWAMLGGSAEIKPEDRQTRPNQPVEETLISELDRRTQGGHPMQDPQFPYRVSLVVDGQVRPGTFIGNDVYVPLSRGEVYSIRIELGPRVTTPVLMRLLVDGLNTLAERATATRGLFVEAKPSGAENPASDSPLPFQPAQRVSLERARTWRLDPATTRRFGVRGFFSDAAKGVYNEFLVADVAELPETRQAFAEQLGLITAAFYQPEKDVARKPPSPDGSRSPIATVPGQERTEKLETFRGEHAGALLGVVHLRYVSPEALDTLKRQSVPSKAPQAR